MDFKAILANKKIVAGAVAALVLLIAVISVYSGVNDARNGIIKREATLTAQYLANQNELSTYVVKIKEMLGIANLNSDKVDQILQDAVKGRYEGKDMGKGGSMISAIVEAYPELSTVSIPYTKVQDAISGGREAYKNVQNLLLDELREYSTWRKSGLIRSMAVSMLGAPTQDLEARIGTNVYRGQAAIDKMYQIVLVSGTTETYETGKMDPIDTNPTPR